MPHRDLILIAYDVTSDRRRARIYKAVRGFGVDAQLSVHECRLSPGERREMWRRLSALVEADDKLMLLVLDPRSRAETLGTPRIEFDPLHHYVG